MLANKWNGRFIPSSHVLKRENNFVFYAMTYKAKKEEEKVCTKSALTILVYQVLLITAIFSINFFFKLYLIQKRKAKSESVKSEVRRNVHLTITQVNNEMDK